MLIPFRRKQRQESHCQDLRAPWGPCRPEPLDSQLSALFLPGLFLQLPPYPGSVFPFSFQELMNCFAVLTLLVPHL